MSPERQSSPSRNWRAVRAGITRTFCATPVAVLSNPGIVYEFHEQLYKKKEGKLIPCSPEETRKARISIQTHFEAYDIR